MHPSLEYDTQLADFGFPVLQQKRGLGNSSFPLPCRHADCDLVPCVLRSQK